MKTNAGYEIIMEMGNTTSGGSTGVALGFMEKSFGPEWVTWEWAQFPSDENPSYFWGHYFSDKNAAMKDYYERCAKHFDRMGSFV